MGFPMSEVLEPIGKLREVEIVESLSAEAESTQAESPRDTDSPSTKIVEHDDVPSSTRAAGGDALEAHTSAGQVEETRIICETDPNEVLAWRASRLHLEDVTLGFMWCESSSTTVVLPQKAEELFFKLGEAQNTQHYYALLRMCTFSSRALGGGGETIVLSCFVCTEFSARRIPPPKLRLHSRSHPSMELGGRKAPCRDFCGGKASRCRDLARLSQCRLSVDWHGSGSQWSIGRRLKFQ